MKEQYYYKIYGMKRVGIFLLFLLISFLPIAAEEQEEIQVPSLEQQEESIPQEKEKKISIFDYGEKKEENGITIFKFQLPEEEIEEEIEEDVEEDIISDDVTADTSKKFDDDYYYEINDETYYLSDMYSDVLKGYAVYNEEDEEGIELEIPESHFLALNIKNPISVGFENYSSLKSDSLFKQNQYSKLNAPEYSITSLSGRKTKQIYNSFSIGTSFSQFIDTGELEQSSGIFSRYQYKRFALTTTYQRTLGTTNSTYSDNFYFAPEYKINDYFTVIERLSANPVTKKKKAEFVLSVNPMGKKDSDRIRFDIGASQSYDDENNLLKSQFKFYTVFKL